MKAIVTYKLSNKTKFSLLTDSHPTVGECLDDLDTQVAALKGMSSRDINYYAEVGDIIVKAE